MVKKRADSFTRNYEHGGQTPKKKPGRPRAADGSTARLTVSVVLLRKVLNALETGAADAQTESIKNQLTTAAHGLAERLGPLADPDHKPAQPAEPRPKRTGWRVVLADGTEHRVKSVGHAASLLKVKESSLRVMLSQQGGRYSARRGDSAVTLEPILA